MYQVAKQKLIVFKRYPYLMTFLQTVLLYPSEEKHLPEQLLVRYERFVKEGVTRLYQNIDRTHFKEGMDVDRAMQLIEWSMGGYQQTLTNQLKQQACIEEKMHEYWDDFYRYLAVLKQVYYKK